MCGKLFERRLKSPGASSALRRIHTKGACCLPAKDFTFLLPGARGMLAAFKQSGARVVITSNAIWRNEADYWSDFRSFGL